MARRTGGIVIWRRGAWLLAVFMLLAACAELDGEQVRLCRNLLPAVEQPGAEIAFLGAERDPAAAHAVKLRYRAAAAEHWLSCRFAEGRLAPGRLTLVGVTTDRSGALSETQLIVLRRFWLGSFEVQAAARDTKAPPARGTLALELLYLLQMSINAIALSCVYGLLAIGYTLIFGMIERINLAFGEMAMLGAFTTVIGVVLLGALDSAWLGFGLVAILLIAMAVSALAGWTVERAVFRPLHGVRSQAVLVATLGLAVFLQEFLRLTQGAGEHWIQRPFAEPHHLAGGASFGVSLTTAQGLILGLTAALYGALHLVRRRTAFGRAQRACADDPAMAALCGVDATRTIALTFALAGACAGAAGLILALHYGGAHFFMGYLIGFKALVAAVIGGIGSLPGAMLGGLLIGLLETFWSGYLTIAYKDIAVFGLLAVFLVLRPQGLFGMARRPGEGE